MPIIATIVCVLLVCVIALLVWLINVISTGSSSQRDQLVSQATSMEMFNKHLLEMKEAGDKLRDTTTKSIQTGQENITKNLEGNQKLISEITKELTNVQNTNKKIIDLSSDLRRLQDILQSPKLRGQLGEWSLENLLNQILPQGSFELQKKMTHGPIVDALVKLDKYSVGIDAKFPLPNFEKMLSAETDEERIRFKKALIKDVKKHIDKIAKDYIEPSQGTLDFAIMYIPAENIYYETVINTITDENDILNHAMSQKVIPVSPNLLYAYLMTIVMGLHGLQIEKQAADIKKNLSKLDSYYNEFVGQWTTLGGHVRNVYNKYDDASKKLDRFEMHLQQIQNETELDD